jgi:hypothetical protein
MVGLQPIASPKLRKAAIPGFPANLLTFAFGNRSLFPDLPTNLATA